VRHGSAKETVSLLTATIKPDLDDSNMRFCFRVVSINKTYALQAESEADRARWMEAITTAIAGLLNSTRAIQDSVAQIGLGSPSRTRSPGPNSPSKGPRMKTSGGGGGGGGAHGRSASFGGFGAGRHRRALSGAFYTGPHTTALAW